MALTSQHQGRGAGMIVDVESDIDGIALRADDLSGGSAALRPDAIRPAHRLQEQFGELRLRRQ